MNNHTKQIIRITNNIQQPLNDETYIKNSLEKLTQKTLHELNKLKFNEYEEEAEKKSKYNLKKINEQKKSNNSFNDSEESIIYTKIDTINKLKHKNYIYIIFEILNNFIQNLYKDLGTEIYDSKDYLVYSFLLDSDYKINYATILDWEDQRKSIQSSQKNIPYTYNDLSRNHQKYFCVAYFSIQKFNQFLMEIIENIQFIPLSDAQKTYKTIYGPTIVPGEYFIHPNDSSILIPSNSYYTSIAKSKNHELIDLLAQMGAKEIKLSEKIQKETSINTNIQAKAIFVSSNASFNIEKDYYNYYEIITTFNTSPHHIIDPNLLRKSQWFHGDPQIETIFKYRASNTVSIQSYSIKIENKQTQKINASIGASITFKIIFGLKLDLDYNNLYTR